MLSRLDRLVRPGMPVPGALPGERLAHLSGSAPVVLGAITDSGDLARRIREPGRGSGSATARAETRAARLGLMGFPLFLLYLAFTFLRSTDRIPELADYPVMSTLAALALVAAVFIWLGILVVTFAEPAGVARLTDDEPVASLARTMQLSLIGFLTAASFLSGTYSTLLFVLVTCASAVAARASRAGADRHARPGRLVRQRLHA